jgi:dTDP-4-dehydrorhamnose reductase
MKVLVLGHKGMLGSIVFSYLNQYYDVHTIDYRYPSTEFIDNILNFDGNWIVNCIGAIPHKYSKFDVNYKLPIFLDELDMFKIIHCSTDDINSDTPYSKSKRKAADWLTLHSKNTHSIQSSVIGGGGLLKWVLSNTEVNGYVKSMWNGITTLEWAKYCKLIIDGIYVDTHISLITDCISKYELIRIISDVYNHNIIIKEDTSIICNNCIDGIYVGTVKNKLEEFKNFYETMLFDNSIL